MGWPQPASDPILPPATALSPTCHVAAFNVGFFDLKNCWLRVAGNNMFLYYSLFFDVFWQSSLDFDWEIHSEVKTNVWSHDCMMHMILAKTKEIVRFKAVHCSMLFLKCTGQNEVNDRRLVLSVSFPAICSETREEQTHASNKPTQHQQVKFSLLRDPWWKGRLELLRIACLVAAFTLPMHWTSMFKVFTAAAWRQSCTTWAPTFRWRNSADLESEDRPLPLKDRAPESSRWFIQHKLQNCGCSWITENRNRKLFCLNLTLFQCRYVCRCNQELDEPVWGSHQSSVIFWHKPNPRLSFAHIFRHPMTSPWWNDIT